MKRIKSIIEGRDNDVLDCLFSFYQRPFGKVIDLTCNKRTMWKGLEVRGVTFCDIDPSVNPDIICSFSKTPFENDSVSTIIFDPPHLPRAAASEKSLKHFAKNYGLKKSTCGDNISDIFPEFLSEAKRILINDGLIFVKITDFVHNHKYQWTLCDLVNCVKEQSGLTATDLIIKKDPAAGNLSSSKWKKSHHARRSHCWWVIIRKGKCEPKKDYSPQPEGKKIGIDNCPARS